MVDENTVALSSWRGVIGVILALPWLNCKRDSGITFEIDGLYLQGVRVVAELHRRRYEVVYVVKSLPGETNISTGGK